MLYDHHAAKGCRFTQPDRATMLDTEEYLHLALHAGAVGDRHACLNYLEKVLEREPKNSKAIHLQAVQHAELGLNERAIKGMKTALSLEPGLEIARFQLGLLLLLNMNRAAEAKEQLLQLRSSQIPVLRTYSEGLIAPAEDNVPLAREKLTLGLAQSPAAAPMSTLMQRLLAALMKADEPASSGPAPAGEISLGAYRQNS
jgi:tetratricopeptide (TPR) repeat protein